MLRFTCFALLLTVVVGLELQKLNSHRQKSQKRNAAIEVNLLWPNATVPYVIEHTLKEVKSIILDGMADYHKHTCVKFVPWKKGMSKDYISIVKHKEACYNSQLGRQGGKQLLQLACKCHDNISVMRELGHAIGLYHEQSRSDRDNFIEILWDNIKDDQIEWFKKRQPWEHNLLGESFDFKSVMMYEDKAFTKNGWPTMRAKHPGDVILPESLKQGLSASDIRRINRLYQCFGEVRPTVAPIPDVKCNSQTYFCAIQNQVPNVGTDFVIDWSTIGKRHGEFYQIEKGNSTSNLATLMTPWWETHGKQNRCLSFDYYSDGEGIAKIIIHQQGHTSVIVAQPNTTTNGEWRHQQIHLPTAKNPRTRFFLQVYFSQIGGPHGHLAFDNIVYSVENYCA